MKKQQLIDQLESLEVEEGFKIKSDTFSFGVQRVDTFDTDTIVFAAYGGELFSYCLGIHSHEEIVEKMEEYIAKFHSNDLDEKLTLEDCYIK